MMKRSLWIILGVIGSIALIFIIPFIVNLLFSISAPFKLWVAQWNEADTLGYGGEVLSYIGTVVLGAIAIFQTGKAHEQTNIANQLAQDAVTQNKMANDLAKEALIQTERANELSAQMQKLEQAKIMSMVSVRDLYIDQQSILNPNSYNPKITNRINFDMVDVDFWTFTECYHIDVIFDNISNFPILELYAQAKGIDGGANIRHGLKPAWSRVYISPNRTQAIRFIIPSLFFEKYPQDGLKISLEFVNVYDFHTYATITIDTLSKYSNKSSRIEYAYQLRKINDIMMFDGTGENNN